MGDGLFVVILSAALLLTRIRSALIVSILTVCIVTLLVSILCVSTFLASTSSPTVGVGSVAFSGVTHASILSTSIAFLSRADAASSPNTVSGSRDFVINEVLYDPEGPDEGLEFVELYNPTEAPLSLRGLMLETGNGAGEGDWSLAVQWDSDYYVQPYGYVTVGENAVSPTPQFVKQLDLQNGPDACRIRRSTETIDLVGWGSHSFPEYYEGVPCEDAASGISVGRLPDGIDTENNSVDFRALSPPSPGRRNFCIVDAGFAPGSLSTKPALPLPFENTEITVEIENLGARELASGECLVEFFGVVDSLRTFMASATTQAIAPKQSEVLSVFLFPEIERCMTLEATLRLEEDENPSNDTASIWLRIGEGNVIVNEIMYAPAAGEPEWVELFNRGQTPVDVQGWWIEDSSKKKARLTSLPLVIGAGEFLVITQDKRSFEEKPNHCEGRAIQPEGSWPSLNNYASGGNSYADVVCIRDSSGCMSDYVMYEEEWSTRSKSSVERVSTSVSSRQAANWSSSVAPSGSTPCERNSVSEAARQSNAFRIGMSSRVMSPDGDGLDDRVIFSFVLPTTGMRANLAVFDSDGRTVKRLLDQRKVGTVVQTIWDGVDEEGRLVRPGIYIVNLGVKRPEGGWEESRSTLVVAPKGMR